MSILPGGDMHSYRKIFVLGAAAAMAFSAPLSAQERSVANVGIRAIERAVQCELGMFAREMRRQRTNLATNRASAIFLVSDKVGDGGGFSAKFSLFGFFNISGEDIRNRNLESVLTFQPRRIHPDNARACSRRADALILTDLRECLARAAEVYDRANVSCNSQINVKRGISVGAQIPVYFVTIGPNFQWGNEYSQGIKVVAPPPR